MDHTPVDATNRQLVPGLLKVWFARRAAPRRPDVDSLHRVHARTGMESPSCDSSGRILPRPHRGYHKLDDGFRGGGSDTWLDGLLFGIRRGAAMSSPILVFSTLRSCSATFSILCSSIVDVVHEPRCRSARATMRIIVLNEPKSGRRYGGRPWLEPALPCVHRLTAGSSSLPAIGLDPARGLA